MIESQQPAPVPTPGLGAFAAIGWDQHLDAVVDDVLDLHLMPVAGIGQQDLRGVSNSDLRELVDGGVDHRLKAAEVGGDQGDLGGDHYLVLVGRGLRVVALDVAQRR